MPSLREALAARSPWLSADAIDRLARHEALLGKWNERAGLVSRAALASGLEAHYLDSIFISAFANRCQAEGPVYDLGSGGGFPGLVFACCFPQRGITLYERASVKRAFLEVAAAALGLDKVSVESEPREVKPKGLWLSRATLPPDELFPYLAERMEADSVAVACAGGAGLAIMPRDFEKLGEERYALPGASGGRHVSAWRFVPRGTDPSNETGFPESTGAGKAKRR